MSSIGERVTKASTFDDFQTPNYATEILVPFLKEKGLSYGWECANGIGLISLCLERNGFDVYRSDINTSYNGLIESGEIKELDFLAQKDLPDPKIDFIITNPPYTLKDKFFRKCYELEIPFAMLVTIRAIGGIGRVKMFKNYGIELLVPTRRVNYIYPDGKDRNWFHSAWFCHNILPEKLVFVDMERK